MDFNCYEKTPWLLATGGGKGVFQFTIPHRGSSSKEVGAETHLRILEAGAEAVAMEDSSPWLATCGLAACFVIHPSQ